MSVVTPTPETFKDKARIIRKFMNERYQIDVSHGHCMELLSQLFGFKDWNTASAALKSKSKPLDLPLRVNTVGDMRTALAHFKDTDYIDGMYDFLLVDFLDQIDGNAAASDMVSQEFSFTLEKLDDSKEGPRFASFRLKLENEELGTPH